jgi:hypothetical protein
MQTPPFFFKVLSSKPSLVSVTNNAFKIPSASGLSGELIPMNLLLTRPSLLYLSIKTYLSKWELQLSRNSSKVTE